MNLSGITGLWSSSATLIELYIRIKWVTHKWYLRMCEPRKFFTLQENFMVFEQVDLFQIIFVHGMIKWKIRLADKILKTSHPETTFQLRELQFFSVVMPQFCLYTTYASDIISVQSKAVHTGTCVASFRVVAFMAASILIYRTFINI